MNTAPTVFLSPKYGIRFPTLSAFQKPNDLGKSNFLTKDGVLHLHSRRNLLPSHSWVIRSQGNWREDHPPRSKALSDNALKKDSDHSGFHSLDGRTTSSSNQEEIIALFKRIQSSISKTRSETARTKKASTDNSNKKQSKGSVSRVARQRKKTVKGTNSTEHDNKGLNPRNEEKNTGGEFQPLEIKIMRHPSNFVKKSPIPSTQTVQKEEVDMYMNKEGFPHEGDGKELQTIEKMKLPELKELAKLRGIRGYSKLKKGDLVELLKGVS